MGCASSKLMQSVAQAAEDPGAAGLAITSVLVGTDLVKGCTHEVPLLKSVLRLIKLVQEKYKARQEVVELLVQLDEHVAFLARAAEHLQQGDTRQELDKGLEETIRTLRSVGSAEKLLKPQEACKALEKQCSRLHKAVARAHFNLTVLQVQPQAGKSYGVAQLAATELVIGPIVGRGGLATVHKGIWHRRLRGGEILATSVAVKAYNTVGGMTPAELHRDIAKNARLQMDVAHQNVLRIFGAAMSHPQLAPTEVLLVMPFIALGSLSDVLYAPPAAAPHVQEVRAALTQKPDALLEVLRGIAAGIAHMHERSPPVLHLDLKTSNVLLERVPDLPNGGNVSVRPLISDFDASEECRTYRTTRTTSVGHGIAGARGTECYMAPERMRRAASSDAPPADVYSFGLMIVECVNLEVPFRGLSTFQLCHAIAIDGLKPSLDVSKPAYLDCYWPLVEACVEANPSSRPKMRTVLDQLTEDPADRSSAVVSATAGHLAPAVFPYLSPVHDEDLLVALNRWIQSSHIGKHLCCSVICKKDHEPIADLTALGIDFFCEHPVACRVLRVHNRKLRADYEIYSDGISVSGGTPMPLGWLSELSGDSYWWDCPPHLGRKGNEVFVWHGTSQDSVEGIVKHGFDLERAGSVHGSAGGVGIYFTPHPQLACCYSTLREDGLIPLVLSRVAPGNRKDLELRHPYPDLSKAPACEPGSSLWLTKVQRGDEPDCDRPCTHELVVCDPRQVCPEYVVLCTFPSVWKLRRASRQLDCGLLCYSWNYDKYV